MSAKSLLLIALAIFGAFYLFVWARSLFRSGPGRESLPTLGQLATGFGTNFFDTLGIGSFAPTTSIFKLWRIVPDERIQVYMRGSDLVALPYRDILTSGAAVLAMVCFAYAALVLDA